MKAVDAPRIIIATGWLDVDDSDTIVIDHGNRCFWRGGRRYLAIETFRMTTPVRHTLFKLVAALLVRAPRPVTCEQMVEHLFGDRDDGGPNQPHNSIWAVINRRREDLAALGVDITAEGRRGQRSWCLEFVSRERRPAAVGGYRVENPETVCEVP